MMSFQVLSLCIVLAIIQGISAKPTDGPSLSHEGDLKRICALPSSSCNSSVLCEVAGPADSSCEAVADAVGASDPSCCDKGVCSFTLPSTKCLVAVTKNTSVPATTSGNPAPAGSPSSSGSASTTTAASGSDSTTPASSSNGSPDEADGVHHCTENGLAIISADVDKICKKESTGSSSTPGSSDPSAPTGSTTPGSTGSTTPSSYGGNPKGSDSTGSTTPGSSSPAL
uniref:Uncharacterized protein n=1 Tax=Cacopsylla melanoneura TaxID=428564 RepID=A0A8D8VJL7_9HEMI